MTQSLPLLADPGTDGDEELVRDVAEDVEEHLVRTLLNVALVMEHHVVTSSHEVTV